MGFTPDTSAIVAAVLFGLALLHTFSTKFFQRIAHSRPRHAGLWHLLGEVEVVFGFWAMVLMLFLWLHGGQAPALAYLESRNFTEPMFVFAIMVIAGTRPVLEQAQALMQALARGLARALPLRHGQALCLVLLGVLPLLGSFITEPAAMTLAALMLRHTVLRPEASTRLKYAVLGVLFVNVSIGGTLTHFAAPPVLMVASAWQWDLGFMFTHFGWKAMLAVGLNAAGATWLLRHELGRLAPPEPHAQVAPVPAAVTTIHLLFLAAVVACAHHPVVFMGLLLFFLGFASAYRQHQQPLILREALLVAFFLGGLVVLGGQQAWWLQPLLMALDADAVFFGAIALTAITDNAALTYLASLVPGLSPEFKTALVGGAVIGGGLTVIANAPNPAGVAILKDRFPHGAVSLPGLLAGALPPTLVAAAIFRLL
jgi:hypothetical protein